MPPARAHLGARLVSIVCKQGGERPGAQVAQDPPPGEPDQGFGDGIDAVRIHTRHHASASSSVLPEKSCSSGAWGVTTQPASSMVREQQPRGEPRCLDYRRHRYFRCSVSRRGVRKRRCVLTPRGCRTRMPRPRARNCLGRPLPALLETSCILEGSTPTLSGFARAARTRSKVAATPRNTRSRNGIRTAILRVGNARAAWLLGLGFLPWLGTGSGERDPLPPEHNGEHAANRPSEHRAPILSPA